MNSNKMNTGKSSLLSDDQVPASTQGASETFASRREPFRQAMYGPRLDHQSHLEQ